MITTYFDELLNEMPVIAILRGHDPATTAALCHNAWDAGIRAVEVPVASADEIDSLRWAVAAGRERGVPVGAGTVVWPEQVAELAAEGAAFLVSPGLDKDVVAAAASLGVPHLPGVATASDVGRAWRFGYTWQKVFPASVLGPGWVQAMRQPFPSLRFVAVGGIDANNAREYINAGCRAIGVGSALRDPRQVELLTQLWAKDLTDHTRP